MKTLAWAWVNATGQVLDVSVTESFFAHAAALVPGSRVIPLAEQGEDRVRQLVRHARGMNRRSVAARKAGRRHQLAEYLRSKAMQEARAMKRTEGGGADNPAVGLKVTLSHLADLVCDIDEQKNQLPAEYRQSFNSIVEATHNHIKTIAWAHGLVVYADQEETREKQTH